MSLPIQLPPSTGSSPFGSESGSTVLVLTFVSLGFAAVCVSLRLYTRFYVLRQPGWDDLCQALGFLAAVGISVTAYYMVKYGLGGNFDELGIQGLSMYLKGSYIILGIFPICTGLLKSALMLQFRRLFQPKSAGYIYSTVVLVLIILWSVAFGIISFFPCFPLAKVLDPLIEGHCYGLGSIFTNLPVYLETLIIQSATNMFLDLLVFGLAIYLMQGVGAKRLGFQVRLAALMLIGLLANICAITRTVFVAEMLGMASELTQATNVMPWGVTLMTGEVNLASICASVPVFWGPLQDKVIEQWDKIFVTKEISIVRSTRYGTDGEDERDLTQQTMSRSDSLTDTDVELSEVTAERQKDKSAHYQDEFVQTYINPLQSEGLGETRILSEGRHKKWYQPQ